MKNQNVQLLPFAVQRISLREQIAQKIQEMINYQSLAGGQSPAGRP